MYYLHVKGRKCNKYREWFLSLVEGIEAKYVN